MARYSINFSEQADGTLRELARATHGTTCEVVRDALSVYWWLARESGRGTRFLVQRGSQVNEVVLPSLKDVEPLQEPEQTPGARTPDEREWSG